MIQATGFLTFTPVGLIPTEHASLMLDALTREKTVCVEIIELFGMC